MVNNDGTNADDNDDAELEADDLPPLEQLDDDQPRQASVQAKTNFTDRKAPSPEPLPDAEGQEEASGDRQTDTTENDADIAAKIKAKLNEIAVA